MKKFIEIIKIPIAQIIAALSFIAVLVTLVPELRNWLINIFTSYILPNIQLCMLLLNCAVLIWLYVKGKLIINAIVMQSTNHKSIMKDYDDHLKDSEACITKIQTESLLKMEQIFGEFKIANDNHIRTIASIKSNLLKNYNDCNVCRREIADFFAHKETNGITSIKTRDKYSNEYFAKLYRNTRNQLVVSGHSLNNTIDPEKSLDLRNAFRDVILRVVRNKGTVKILLQTVVENGSAKNRNVKNGSDRKRQILNKFIIEVQAEIRNLIEKNQISGNIHEIMSTNLLIKETRYLPYYVVQCDQETLIAQYKMSRSGDANKDIYIFSVNKSIGYGQCYIDDFNSVFDTCASFINFDGIGD